VVEKPGVPAPIQDNQQSHNATAKDSLGRSMQDDNGPPLLPPAFEFLLDVPPMSSQDL
jgi:hypothetical protein